MSKISIIIPVYNVEEYIRECFNSIIAQTFTDFEVIAIDDGSTDKSGYICDEYAAKDDRFRIFHKKNEGVSEARNVALSNVMSEFVCFIDSDDYIRECMLENLYDLVTSKNADMAMAIKSYSKVSDIDDTSITTKIYTQKKAQDCLFSFSKEIGTSLWMGIYRAKLFKKVSLPAHIHFFEDYATQVLLQMYSKCTATTSKQLYFYRQRKGSANHVGITDKVITCLSIDDYFLSNKVYRTITDRYNVQAFFTSQCFYSNLNTKNPDLKYTKVILKYIKKNYIGILKATSIPLVSKILMLVFLVLRNHFLMRRLYSFIFK